MLYSCYFRVTTVCLTIYIYVVFQDSLSLVLLQQSRINNQMSQRTDKIWKVNLVILMKLRMPPQASHDG